MKNYYNIHTIWLTLLLLTLASFLIGEIGLSGTGAVLFLLITAATKGAFIIHNFMELQGVSLIWRIIMYGWLGIICLAIAITYVISL